MAIGGNEARSNNGNWAGRFPEMVQGDAEGSSGDTDSDDGDPLGGTANNTLIPSRPNSVMGQATSVPMGIPISNGMEMGRSRSGSTVGGDMMIVGSYGMGGEFAEMDLDMAVCSLFSAHLLTEPNIFVVEYEFTHLYASNKFVEGTSSFLPIQEAKMYVPS